MDLSNVGWAVLSLVLSFLYSNFFKPWWLYNHIRQRTVPNVSESGAKGYSQASTSPLSLENLKYPLLLPPTSLLTPPSTGHDTNWILHILPHLSHSQGVSTSLCSSVVSALVPTLHSVNENVPLTAIRTMELLRNNLLTDRFRDSSLYYIIILSGHHFASRYHLYP